MYDIFVDSAKVHGDFYRSYLKDFNTIYIKYSKCDQIEYISANINSRDYLLSKIEELDNIDFAKRYYYILPILMKNNSTVIDELNQIVEFNEGSSFANEYEVIYYNNNINLVGIDEDSLYGSNLVENSSIIYNNMSFDEILNQNKDYDLERLDYNHDLMYKI